MDNTGIDLTAIIRKHGVKHITDLGSGFAVHLHDNAFGTGVTVGAALDNALVHRQVLTRLDRIAA